MVKLFEIPVYAMSRKNLSKRYCVFRKRLQDKQIPCSEEHMNGLVELMTYPYRLWDYNHIIGYIQISIDRRDVLFDIFLPMPNKERYRWRSERKIFLYNILANGTHFYVSDQMRNEDIQVRTAEMLREVIETHIPKRYCVDTEAFDHLNNKLDYISVIEEAQKRQREIELSNMVAQKIY